MRIIVNLIVLASLFGCTPSTKQVQSAEQMTDVELKQYAQDIAQRYVIVDGHVDLPYRMKVEGFMIKKEVLDVSQLSPAGNFDYPRSKAGGLDAPFMSIYIPSSYQVTGGAKDFADSLIKMVKKIPANFPHKFAVAHSPKDIRENFEKGLVSLPMGMENGAPIGNDLANVKYYFDQGVRYVTLTHAKDNQICDSSYDTTRTWKGLSEFGKIVVKEMNKVGMIVDISHVSDDAFYQALEITEAPVIASHSSCRKFVPGFERNMNDDMIKKLAENGGVIHINFGSTFLSQASRDKFKQMREHLLNWRTEMGLPSEDQEYLDYAASYAEEKNVYEDVHMVVDHIEHVKSLVGIDHIGFGSDFDGVGDTLPIGLKDVSMYPNVIYELLKKGYSEEEIEKICYLNTFRVWKTVQEVAKKLQKAT
ncbi:MAG: dipeptidase [Cyclobacteriaceae bacterium]|nr:dipeptidase [Cyclobacteriaceae bacterium HetDA_MAG_MS6]